MSQKKGEALVGNAADEEQVAKAATTVAEREARERLDVRAVLATPEGRRELMRRQDFCGELRISFTGEAPLTMAFNEGQRNVALWEKRRAIRLAPELYLMAVHEYQQEKRIDA